MAYHVEVHSWTKKGELKLDHLEDFYDVKQN